jgi:hypothetical protein
MPTITAEDAASLDFLTEVMRVLPERPTAYYSDRIAQSLLAPTQGTKSGVAPYVGLIGQLQRLDADLNAAHSRLKITESEARRHLGQGTPGTDGDKKLAERMQESYSERAKAQGDVHSYLENLEGQYPGNMACGELLRRLQADCQTSKRSGELIETLFNWPDYWTEEHREHVIANQPMVTAVSEIEIDVKNLARAPALQEESERLGKVLDSLNREIGKYRVHTTHLVERYTWWRNSGRGSTEDQALSIAATGWRNCVTSLTEKYRQFVELVPGVIKAIRSQSSPEHNTMLTTLLEQYTAASRVLARVREFDAQVRSSLRNENSPARMQRMEVTLTPAQSSELATTPLRRAHASIRLSRAPTAADQPASLSAPQTATSALSQLPQSGLKRRGAKKYSVPSAPPVSTSLRSSTDPADAHPPFPAQPPQTAVPQPLAPHVAPGRGPEGEAPQMRPSRPNRADISPGASADHAVPQHRDTSAPPSIPPASQVSPVPEHPQTLPLPPAPPCGPRSRGGPGH